LKFISKRLTETTQNFKTQVKGLILLASETKASSVPMQDL